MIYEYAITISANTNETNATLTPLSLASGTITFFGVEFPKGCAGLVSVEIYEKTVKLWPVNKNASFVSDGEVLKYNPNYELVKAPYELTAKIWNVDGLYDHTPIIRFEVVGRGETLIERMVRIFALG